MRNPWLDIPLEDYEAHMALSGVRQAEMLTDILAAAIADHAPTSLALLGCAGGNGLDRIDAAKTTRVVAVDINPLYVAEVGRRYRSSLPGLELVVADVSQGELSVAPVELVSAALLFEYVDLMGALHAIRSLSRTGTVLSVVLQTERDSTPFVSPSPYRSLAALEGVVHRVSPAELTARAGELGYALESPGSAVSFAGKEFSVMTFRLQATLRSS